METEHPKNNHTIAMLHNGTLCLLSIFGLHYKTIYILLRIAFWLYSRRSWFYITILWNTWNFSEIKQCKIDFFLKNRHFSNIRACLKRHNKCNRFNRKKTGILNARAGVVFMSMLRILALTKCLITLDSSIKKIDYEIQTISFSLKSLHLVGGWKK